MIGYENQRENCIQSNCTLLIEFFNERLRGAGYGNDLPELLKVSNFLIHKKSKQNLFSLKIVLLLVS